MKDAGSEKKICVLGLKGAENGEGFELSEKLLPGLSEFFKGIYKTFFTCSFSLPPDSAVQDCAADLKGNLSFNTLLNGGVVVTAGGGLVRHTAAKPKIAESDVIFIVVSNKESRKQVLDQISEYHGIDKDGQLKHPEKKIYILAESNNGPFFGKEYCDAETLAARFRELTRGCSIQIPLQRTVESPKESVASPKSNFSHKACGGWTLFGGGLTAVIGGALLYGLMSMGMLALSLSPAVYALLIIGAVMAVSSTLCIYPSASSQAASKM